LPPEIVSGIGDLIWGRAPLARRELDHDDHVLPFSTHLNHRADMAAPVFRER